MITGSQGFRSNREYEPLSRRAKRYVRWRPGVRAKAKRKHWKQNRRGARHDMSAEI